MSNKARAVFGGLLAGVGDGMSKQGARKAETAERMRREALEEARRSEDRQWAKEDAAAAADAARGEIKGTVTNEKGELEGYNKWGEPIATGIRPQQTSKSGDSKNSSGLSSGDLNTIERISKSYWSTLNADGQVMLPEDARDNYAQTTARAEQLAAMGVPIGKASQIAAQSIKGPMDKSEAKRIATIQANDQDFEGSWLGENSQSKQKERWIEAKTQSLIEESSAAGKEFERLTGGGTTSGGTGGMMQGPAPAATSAPVTSQQNSAPKSGAPAGGGTQADPYQGSTQSDVEWFKQNAPKGAIISFNGELYQK